jgi:O-antigen ligase
VNVTRRAGRVRQLAASLWWATLVLLLAVVLGSAALSPASNWTVRTALAGFCMLAVTRPDAALLITIALVGFGIILSHLGGVPPLRVTEVLVVGALAGFFVRAVPPGSPYRRALNGWISVPVSLFAIAVATSSLVWQRIYQVETGYLPSYFQTLWKFVSREYFIQPGDFWVLVSAAVILEGLALYVVAAALCRMDATFFDRALRMLAIGGAGLAMMSIVRLGEILLRSPGAIQAMRASSGVGLRISPQIPDYIAAGSYFSLCWLAALGIAMSPAPHRPLWVASGLPLIAALYLTGSRSVIAAALVGLVTVLVIVSRQRGVAVRGVAAFAVVAVAVMVLSYQWIIGRDVVGETARQSLTVRAELLRTGTLVIATRPVFGVGIDRFYVVAGELASSELRALWPGRMNPHNDFLRFGGELGLVGLGLFLWILASATTRTWKALGKAHDARLAGIAGGLAAFLVTSLFSSPLMFREVSYAFWVALGLAVGRAAGQAAGNEPEATSESARRPRLGARARWLVPVLVGGLLVFSVPFRVRQELAAADISGVSYGFFEWGREPDGRPSRWSGPRATLFVSARARLVEIPLSGATPSGVLQHVEVRVDGRLANRVAVGREWQRVRTLLPATPSIGPRRIDLVISPPWVPAEMIPGNTDQRVLGVRVGEIKIVPATDQSR